MKSTGNFTVRKIQDAVYSQKIDSSDDVSERKRLRSEREFSVRGKSKVEHEIGLTLMVANI